MIAAIISWAALSLQWAVVNKMLSLTTSLSVKSDNPQLLHMLLVLERELVHFFFQALSTKDGLTKGGGVKKALYLTSGVHVCN